MTKVRTIGLEAQSLEKKIEAAFARRHTKYEIKIIGRPRIGADSPNGHWRRNSPFESF